MIESIEVKHNIKGRLRLSIKPIAKLKAVMEEIERSYGVNFVRINESCSSLVVFYNPNNTSFEKLYSIASSFLVSSFVSSKSGCNSGELECSCTACSCPDERHVSSVKKNLARFLSLSGVMSFVFAKRLITGVVASQALFSPLGLISIAASVPLLLETYDHIRGKRFTLEGFLAAGCLAATGAGQALTALEILWIQSGAETLNAWVSERSRSSISNILDQTAQNTFILVGNVEVEIPVSAVKPRDIVVLHTGEKISIDGEVVFGEALVNEAPITGHNESAHAKVGSHVFAGSYIEQGVIHVRAECVGDKTYLSRIMNLVESSLENKAPIESTADRLAKNLVKVGFLATAGTLLLTGNLWRAFTVMLVMACPCATALSAQTAVSASMSAAAKKGILIKGGRYLEDIASADIVCFDKTGTLTSNQPSIKEILSLGSIKEDELIKLAYSAEAHSHHPIAQAIKKEALLRKIDPISHEECSVVLGKGIQSKVDSHLLQLGSLRYMQDVGVDVGVAKSKIDSFLGSGSTVVCIARDGKLIGVIAFANEPRADAKSVVSSLRQLGVKKIVLITGDSEHTAKDLSDFLGLDACYHSVLPEQKGDIVTDLLKDGKVIMVGDGINDALALAKADIGIAVTAGGSDVAIEAADIVLVKNDLTDIVYVRELGSNTLKVAHQNFLLATSTNVGGAIAGASGFLSPVAAGLLHIVHTLGVLANSSRLLFEKNSLS